MPEQNWVYGAQIRFGWQPPAAVQLPSITEAAALAGRSDVAISDLAYWNIDEQRFVVEHHTIQIRIGRSSADILLLATLNVM